MTRETRWLVRAVILVVLSIALESIAVRALVDLDPIALGVGGHGAKLAALVLTAYGCRAFSWLVAPGWLVFRLVRVAFPTPRRTRSECT